MTESIIAQFPHCDQRILHAPGECEYCDKHPEWQELRKMWGIAFTGHTPTEEQYAKQLPCPADFNRGENHQKWGGNVAKPKSMEVVSGDPERVPVEEVQIGELGGGPPRPLGKVRVATDGVTPGYEDKGAPGPLKENGQHTSYWVLSEEERAKGFVRPVRRAYKHVGLRGPVGTLRELTAEEKERYDRFGYVRYEEYPAARAPVTGRFWTQAQLDKIEKGCGTTTTMSLQIAETYAREPSFNGSTFCVGCGTHLPVGDQGEFVWVDETGRLTNERVGT